MNDPAIKQVKVDNWGIFFLQRLQNFFNRSEYCDLILQFNNNERVKVHRLVLNACTEYFQTLEKQGECLICMPKELQPEVVVPIINFMYTGRLEFRSELHARLYATAQLMNMTVLTKLLDAQNMTSPTAAKPLMIKRMAPVPVTWNLQGKKIVPKQVDPDLPEMLPGRKLPIWKRRSVPSSLPSYFTDSPMNNHEGPSRVTLSKIEEVARPTRFDWPDDDFQPTSYSTSFDDISYESKPIVKPIESVRSTQQTPPSLPPPPHLTPCPAVRQETKTVSFEDIRRSVVSIKRPILTSVESCDSKKAKMMDLQAVKEYVEEHRLRKDLLDTEENSEDVDDDLAVADLDDDDDDVEDENEAFIGVLSGPAPVQMIAPQKSILKSQGSHEEVPVSSPALTTSKKVRFSLDSKSAEGKENESKVYRLDEGAIPPPSRVSNVSVGNPANAGNLSNHAKIITEVLKKYPHLVKNNKNIRLKIMQRGGQTAPTTLTTDADGNKVVKSKVSYVVLKSEVAGKGKPAVVLKHGGHVEPLSELGGQKAVSGAENTTGPWLCHSCGTNEEPINFETYYQYRRHLQDVHMEKIDARICEHCGHRASKRNLLLYHLYTRHNVPPPRNCQFPKCDQCDYVALSESLLIKHRNNHSNNKEFVCKVCNAAFKSNGALQGHMQTNLHSDPAKKLYECPFCLKPFVRNINLKAHVRTAHKDLAKKLEENTRVQLGQQQLNQEQLAQLQMSLQECEDGDEPQVVNPDDPLADSDVSVMEVPVITTVPQTKSEPGTVVLTSGMTVLAEAPTVQSLVPSSEAEALSNVASGIAASLGLADTLTGEQTVIVLDENQEFILHTTEVVGEETAATEVQEYMEETLVGPEGQEYIVPEIMSNEELPYPGPLSDLEHYTGENQNPSVTTSAVVTENRALAASQPTAPPPINVIPEGEEIALVLSDHDYAEDSSQKENCGQGMMFIITQPVMQGEVMEHVIQSQEQEVHTLQEEETIPHQELSIVLPSEQHEINSVEIVPVLTAESNSASVSTLVEKAQMEIVEVRNVEDSRETPIDAVQLDDSQESVPDIQASSEDILITHDSSTIIETDSTEPEDTPIRTYSTKKVISVSSAAIRRVPIVQMADLVKEWDDFDDSSQESSVPVSGSVVEGGIVRFDETADLHPQVVGSSQSLTRDSQITKSVLK